MKYNNTLRSISPIDENNKHNAEAFLVLSVDYTKFDIRDVLNTCSCNDCIATCSHLISGGDYGLELRADNGIDLCDIIKNIIFTINGILRTEVYMSGSRVYPVQI